MKKITIRDVGLFLLLLLYLAIFSLGFVSCSARKSSVEISQETSKSTISGNSVTEKESSKNIKEISTIKIDDKNQTITEETTYQPEDPTKEASIVDDNGKKIVLNNSKKTTKKTIQNNNTKSETKSGSEIKQNEASKEKKNVKQVSESKVYKKQKETKKEAFPWYYFVLAFFCIVIIVWLFTKYKDKIWWI